MSTTQITQITNGLRPMIEYVDLELSEDLLIFTEVETIDNCFGFTKGKQFEQISLNIATGEIELIDEDCVYQGRVKIVLPDQFDELPRASFDGTETDEEDTDDLD